MTSSMGWNMMTGGRTGFTINFGFGGWDVEKGKWDWADFSGDWLSDIGTVSGYAGLGEDLAKLEYQIFESKEVKEWNKGVQKAYDDPNVAKTKSGKWEYWEVEPPPDLTGNQNNLMWPWQDEIMKSGGDRLDMHFRSRLFHATFDRARNLWTVHRNQFPAMSLMGLGAIPHSLLEGRLSDLTRYIGIHNTGIVDQLRWSLLSFGTGIYDNRYLLNSMSWDWEY